MSVELVIGRSGSGKSAKCIKDAEKLSEEKKNVYIIVPDQFSHRSEMDLIENMRATSSETVSVITFKRLADRIFEKSGYTRAKTISKAGKQMLAMRAVYLEKKNLVTYKRSADSVGFSKKISEIISEFKRYNITQQMVSDVICKQDDPVLKGKLSDISRIYERYNTLISDTYTDAEDDLYIAAALLVKLDYLNGANIFIDEFNDFLPSHYALLEVILKRCENAKFYLCAQKNDEEGGFFADAQKTIEKLKQLCYRFGADLKITYLEENLRHKNNRELAKIEKEYTEFKNVRFGEECKNVSIFESNSIYEELEYICAKITNLCRTQNYKYSDICVAVGDVESYKEAVKLVFDTYDIPFFVADKEKVIENPMVVAVLSALDIFLYNFKYEDVFLYLKSGFSNLTAQETDILENYVLEAGIGKKQWLSQEKWEYKNSFLSTDLPKIYENIDEIRKKALLPLMELREKIGSKNTVRTAAQGIFEFMCNIGMEQKVQKIIEDFKREGKLFKANMYAEIYNSILKVLDQCVLIAGDDKMGIQQFKNMIAAGFDGENSAFIPQTIDEVYVCSVSDARAAKCKVMFAAGTNTGEFMMFGASEGILSDEERDLLKVNDIEIAPGAKDKISAARVGIYKTITRPSDKLFLSYSLSDFESNAMSASQLCEKIKKILNVRIYDNLDLDFPYEYKYEKKYPAYLNLCSNLSKHRGGEKISPIWHSIYDYLKEKDDYKDKISLMTNALNYKNTASHLKSDITDTLYQNTITASASKLERYRGCPFSYFIEFTLKAKERKKLKIGAPDIGSVIHTILERFVKICIDAKADWKELDEEKVSAILKSITSEYFANIFDRTSANTKANKYLLKRVETNLTRCALLIVKHMRQGKFEPVECEAKFGSDGKLGAVIIDITSGKKLKINGIIDRIDKYEDESGTYWRVVDYKSGSKTFSLGKIIYGLDLQLALYLYVATKDKKNSKPAAMFYFKVAEPMISSETVMSNQDAQAEVLKKMKLDGVVLEDDNIVKAMDTSITSKSDILPVEYKTDGSFKKNSSVICEKEFETIFKHIKKNMKEIGKSILAGNCDISPCSYDKYNACEYCKYSSVCRFDKKGGKYNSLEKLNAQAAREKLNEMYKEES